MAMILERLGARLEHGVTADQGHDYSRRFDVVDCDGDGRHSKQEYIEKGNYLTPQSLFERFDANRDGELQNVEVLEFAQLCQKKTPRNPLVGVSAYVTW